MRRSITTPLLAAVLALVSNTAFAAGVATPSAEPLHIYGGAATPTCGWPTTVFVDGCTGTLVHPEVVVFAAHCMFFAGGASPPAIGFGEAAAALERVVPTADCTMFPGWMPDESGFGFDVAFCVLAEPVTDVPVVPILMGCETEILQPDQEITLVGFGATETGMFEVKHEVVTTINGSENATELLVGGNGLSSCNGDSGGPAYVQLEDGSWRAFGITSRGTSADCNQESIYGLIPAHVEWIEETSGIDVTPCHDANGVWTPTEECTEFPMTPGIGESTWAEGCSLSRLSAPAATCGTPFGEDTGNTGGVTTGTGTSTGDASGTADASDQTGGSSGGGETGETGTDASPSTTEASTTGVGTETDAPAGQDDPADDSGCGCTTGPVPSIGLFPLGALLFSRRRRRHDR